MDEHGKSQETLEANEEESGRTLGAPAATSGSSAYFADAEDTERESSNSSSSLLDRSSIQAELPTYLSSLADVCSDIDTLKWWKDHHAELPHWSSAALKEFLVQLSSAAAEQVFSLLKNASNTS